MTIIIDNNIIHVIMDEIDRRWDGWTPEHPTFPVVSCRVPFVYVCITIRCRHWWNKECRSFIHVLNDVTINGGYGQNGAHHFGRYDTKATRELQPLQRLKKTLAMVFRRGPRDTFRPLNLGWGGWGRGWGCNHPPANLPGWSHGAAPPTSSPFSYFLHI